MKKNMKKVLFTILMFLGNLQIVQGSTYYENHMDWSTYCMRAKNINITQTEYEKMRLSKDTSQELTNRSHITIKSGEANKEFVDWQEYSGALYVDVSRLMDIDKIQQEVTRTIIFYMDRDDQTKNYLGVLVTVTPNKGISGGDVSPGEVEKPKQPGGIEEKNPTEDVLAGNKEEISKVEIEKNKEVNKDHYKTKKEEKGFWEWLFSGDEIPVKIPIFGGILYMTPLALTQANISWILMVLIFLIFLGDIRMLMKYKRDKEKYICSRYK